MLAVFIVVNLFIAVVINNLEAVKAEERATASQAQTVTEHDILYRVQALRMSLDELELLLQSQQETPKSRQRTSSRHSPRKERRLTPRSCN